jgi:hypothetical protein
MNGSVPSSEPAWVRPAFVFVDEHHVRRLQISMDDAQRVGSADAFANLHADPQRAGGVDATLFLQQAVERDAREHFHNDVHVAVVGFAELQHLRDVMALDARGGFGFAQETL